MTRFRDEIAIIRPIAWVIALLVYACMALLFSTVIFRHEPQVAAWPLAGKIAFVGGIALLPAVLVLVIGYVYADGKRRGMRYVLWTLLAIFVPQGLGIVIYFIMRDPLLIPCPSCGTPSKQNFAYCSKCGTAIAPTCRSCGRQVEREWTHCAYCGTAVGAAQR